MRLITLITSSFLPNLTSINKLKSLLTATLYFMLKQKLSGGFKKYGVGKTDYLSCQFSSVFSLFNLIMISTRIA